MTFERENIGELTDVISIKIEAEDYKPKVEKAIRDFAKKAQMPGFRTGMVPAGMIKKMHGKKLLVDEINKLLQDSLHKYIVDNKIDVLGSALPRTMDNGIDWDNQEEFKFEYEIATAPKFEIDLNNETFTKRVVKFDDELIETNVVNIAKRYGETINPETVENNDLVYLDFTELNVDGTVKDNGVFANAPVAFDTVPNEEVRNVFVGKGIGFAAQLNPVSLLQTVDELPSLLGITAAVADTVSNNFEAKITKISRMGSAELNEEFFKKVYGPGVTTIEQFKEKIAAELKAMFEADSMNMLLNDIQKRLLEKANIALPAAFLKRWIKMVNEKPLTDEQIESEWPAYENTTRWQMIETRLINDNNITVTEQEARENVENAIRTQFSQISLEDTSQDLFNGFADRILKDEKERSKVLERIYREKLMQVYQTKCTIVEQEFDEKEFYKQA